MRTSGAVLLVAAIAATAPADPEEGSVPARLVVETSDDARFELSAPVPDATAPLAPEDGARDMRNWLSDLGGFVVRAGDGSLRSVRATDVLHVVRLDVKRVELATRDGAFVEGELLTGVRGRAADGAVVVASARIRRISWSSAPEPAAWTGLLAGLREGSSPTSTADAKFASAAGTTPRQIVVTSPWYAVPSREGGFSPATTLVLGVDGAWTARCNARTSSSLALAVASGGGVRVSLSVPGNPPLRDAEVFPAWEIADAGAAAGPAWLAGWIDAQLVLTPLSSLGAVEVSVRPRVPPDPPGPIEVAASGGGAATQRFALFRVESRYQGAETLLAYLATRDMIAVAAPDGGRLCAFTDSLALLSRKEDGECDVLLADGFVMRGAPLTDVKGFTSFGWIAVTSRALRTISIPPRGASPTAAGPLDAVPDRPDVRVRAAGGARYDLRSSWLAAVPRSPLDAQYTAVGHLETGGSGWRDAIDLVRVTEVVLRAQAPDGSAPRVATIDGTILHGPLRVVRNAPSAVDRERPADPWLCGADGSALRLLPFSAVESFAVAAAADAPPWSPCGTARIQGAIPPERLFDDLRPVLQEPRFSTDSFLHWIVRDGDAGFAPHFLLRTDGEFLTAVPRTRVRSVSRDGAAFRVEIAALGARPGLSASGELVTAAECTPRFGLTTIAPSALDSIAFRVGIGGAEGLVEKYRYGGRLAVVSQGGRKLVLDDVFVADAFARDDDPEGPPGFRIGGVLHVTADGALREIAFAQCRGLIVLPAAGSGARVRVATEGGEIDGELKLLTAVRDRTEQRGPPGTSDWIGGWNEGLLRLLPLSRLRALEPCQPAEERR